MGARQSKRSVDITTTPKKEGVPAEGVVVGDAAAPGDGKLERIEEADTKPTTNGIAPHTESAEDKEKDKDEATEKDKEQQPQQEEVKVEETKQESSGDSPAEVAEVTTPTEATPASPNTATSPDNKETKKKEKKKKWSFRSISFSKKDKTKPSRDETPKNGDVTKEEPLAETPIAHSSFRIWASSSSPSPPPLPLPPPPSSSSIERPDAGTLGAVAMPTDGATRAFRIRWPYRREIRSVLKYEQKTRCDFLCVLIESRGSFRTSYKHRMRLDLRMASELSRRYCYVLRAFGGEDAENATAATSSPVEEKSAASNPSPLQQARQAAANATALAEALKLPAVAADKEESTPPASPVPPPDVAYPSSREDILPQESRENQSITIAVASPTSLDFSTDNLPPTEATFVLAEVECLPVVEAEIEVETSQDIKRCLLSSKDRITTPEFCPLDDIESTSDAPTCSLSEKHLSEPQTLALSPEPESVPISLEDLPPASEDTGTQSLDSFDYPLPPEELSCPLLLIPPANISVAELPPAPVEHAANPRDPTETLLTPPLSPNFQQSSVTPGIATETATKDRSQIPSYDEDDNSNREQSMLLSEPLTMSCDQSNIELKDRLTTECVAKTESQEEALSCQLSNAIPSTVAKEHHQNAPEIEAPVENNVAHDVSTTESTDEAPKVAPPAVPTEAPASPPTAPAITEDVASVTKAIEEIDISDKAVAAAVNEAIECNTNEIIADAHHQNNINE
ncbi:hypothetical protein ALC60_06398 [Trachymyrmex zeteki]|uniref:Uncharacterized protein n=1 Tax=Mycetomoellerius zeteki TaxID=64791 RepID=A0A151X2Z7_9HYME|nr:hypothetical protein ALC60_06398 [Trachymyrmex zeteki]